MERGVETWAKNLKEKSPNDFSVTIVGGEKYKFKTNNWFIHRLLILVHVIISFPEWVKAEIIVPTNGTFQTLICRIVTWLAGKPMIVFGHSGLGADDKWNLLCCPDIFVAFSSPQAAWANKFKVGKTKVVTIPHAVDTLIFSPDKKNNKTFDVVCVAANSPSKRVELVEQAVKFLDNVTLQIVGSGQAKQVPYNMMPTIYNQAKVFCFVPETWEAFGLVYLEALACNIPVVAVNDAVRREIIGQAGILIDSPQDTRKLADAIDQALNTKWSTIPRQQAEKFSWEKILPLYFNLWRSLG